MPLASPHVLIATIAAILTLHLEDILESLDFEIFRATLCDILSCMV